MDQALKFLPLILAVAAALLWIHRTALNLRKSLEDRVTKVTLSEHVLLETARFAELESKVHKHEYDLGQFLGSLGAVHARVDATTAQLKLLIDALEKRFTLLETMLLENNRATFEIAKRMGVPPHRED